MPVKEGHCMWSAKTGIFVCLFVFLRKLQNTGEMTPTFTYLFSDYCSAVLIHLVWLIANVHTLIPLCPQKRIAIITHCHNLSLLLRGVSYAAAASYPYVSPWSLALRQQSLACHLRVALASAPEEEEANAPGSCYTRLFLAKWFMVPKRI